MNGTRIGYRTKPTCDYANDDPKKGR